MTLQSAFHIFWFCIHRFNQLQIQNILKKKFRDFQRVKLEFTTCWQLFTQHICFIYNYLHSTYTIFLGFPGGSVSAKESTSQYKRCGFDSWVGKIPWRRKQQLIPVFLPGKSQGQRSLVGYCTWGHKRAGHDLVTEQYTMLGIISYLQMI